MAVSLAYPMGLLSQQTASLYNTASDSNPASGIRLDLSVSSISLKPGEKIAITTGENDFRLFPNEVRASDTASDSNSGLGIRLDLSLSSISLKPGEKIAVTISENNLRPFPNEVRAASDWKFQGLSLGPCGTVNRPIGFAIFKGNYTNENISAGHSLQLYLGTYFCPMILSRINSYVFEPLSNLADVGSGCAPNPCFPLQIEGQTQVAGAWREPILPFPGLATFHQFSPGVYTVAGGDEWGDLIVLHFTVSSP